MFSSKDEALKFIISTFKNGKQKGTKFISEKDGVITFKKTIMDDYPELDENYKNDDDINCWFFMELNLNKIEEIKTQIKNNITQAKLVGNNIVRAYYKAASDGKIITELKNMKNALNEYAYFDTSTSLSSSDEDLYVNVSKLGIDKTEINTAIEMVIKFNTGNNKN